MKCGRRMQADTRKPLYGDHCSWLSWHETLAIAKLLISKSYEISRLSLCSTHSISRVVCCNTTVRNAFFISYVVSHKSIYSYERYCIIKSYTLDKSAIMMSSSVCNLLCICYVEMLMHNCASTPCLSIWKIDTYSHSAY